MRLECPARIGVVALSTELSRGGSRRCILFLALERKRSMSNDFSAMNTYYAGLNFTSNWEVMVDEAD